MESQMDFMVLRLIENALAEDIGAGDVTTDLLVPEGEKGKGYIVAKEGLVVAGTDIACRVFEFLDPMMKVDILAKDGEWVEPGSRVIEASGSMRGLLAGERTALNFLQRLSGIATYTRRCVKELEGTDVRLVDTRKTTPGLRVLEKYAVRVGGAHNHRAGLFDGVLIKDNHIAACGGIRQAIERARGAVHHLLKTEIEVSSLEQVGEAITAGADVVMLDNMDEETIRKAVEIINGRALVEVSGSVKMEDLRRLAKTGVDIISMGSLTHSARAVDLSMRISSKVEESANS
ncbi:MAG: nicotinate-nucleotide diphosphorylase (carboxylating) [Desulfococcus sp. 4484_241]|nr:MAG: nicotinate-nucleotide diphosphorylase (carboxylating) [Desulfococcus sp. 4484_241]